MPAVDSRERCGPLQGRRILVGVTAGIAAYKAAFVVRGLAEMGADVRVVPTPSSLEFVGKATWEALSHNPVTTSVFEEVPHVAHVDLGHSADALVVVPATADFLARARMGRADDLLTASLLMARGPVVLAPAMHTEMWEHPATQENIAILRGRGVHVIEPDSGRLTGRDTGPGRLPEPSTIVQRVVSALAFPTGNCDLAGRTIVVTAGGTQEALDPVRVLTNRSTGKQGVAIATAALVRGARVTLIAANIDVEPPTGVRLLRSKSAADIASAVEAEARDADVLVMAAAVSDFTATRSESKVKKNDDHSGLTLHLTETVDVLRRAVENRTQESGPRVIVGFAAETGDSSATALEHARRKAQRKGADLLAFNDLTRHNFGSDTNHVTLLNAEGDTLGECEGTKDDVAHGLLSAAHSLLSDN